MVITSVSQNRLPDDPFDGEAEAAKIWRQCLREQFVSLHNEPDAQLAAMQPQWEERHGMQIASRIAGDDAIKLDAVGLADLFLGRLGSSSIAFTSR